MDGRALKLLGILLIGIVLGGGIAYTYTSIYGRGPTGSLTQSNCPSHEGSILSPKASLSPVLLQFAKDALDNIPPPINQTQLYEEFTALFSDSNFQNSSKLSFDFGFARHSEFNQEMYAGNSSSIVWDYPTQVEFGSQDGLLFAYIKVLNLFGSPYGNQSNRGSNELTMLLHTVNWTFGLGEVSAMVSGPFSSDLASYAGRAIRTPDGFFVYDSLNFLPHNQTYYTGPPDYNHPLGSGMYDAQNTANQTGILWSTGLISGTYTEPLMTQYFFIVNASSIPHSSRDCTDLSIMFNITSLSPFATSTISDFQVTDNFPTNSINGPLNYSSYLNVLVPLPIS